jgi:hypothetical protein
MSLTPLATAFGSNKLYHFDFTGSAWSVIAPKGAVPPGRVKMGFAATPAGVLYVFGGMDANFGEHKQLRRF